MGAWPLVFLYRSPAFNAFSATVGTTNPKNGRHAAAGSGTWGYAAETNPALMAFTAILSFIFRCVTIFRIIVIIESSLYMYLR